MANLQMSILGSTETDIGLVIAALENSGVRLVEAAELGRATVPDVADHLPRAVQA